MVVVVGGELSFEVVGHVLENLKFCRFGVFRIWWVLPGCCNLYRSEMLGVSVLVICWLPDRVLWLCLQSMDV